MFPSTSALVVVLSLSAATLATPPRRPSAGGHSVAGTLAEGALKGAISAFHYYTESKQQQQLPPPIQRSDDEYLEARFDEELEFEAREPGEFSHLALKYGGKLVEEAIPAVSAHFQSKKQKQNNGGQVQGRDFEEGDYELRDFEDGDFQEREYDDGEYEARELEDGDFEARDFEDGDFQERDFQDGDFEERDDDEMVERDDEEMVDLLRRYIVARYETGGWGEIFRQAGEASAKVFGGPAPEPKPKAALAKPKQQLASPQQHLSAPPSPPHLPQHFQPVSAQPVLSQPPHPFPEPIIPTRPFQLSHPRDVDIGEELLSRDSGEFDELD